MATKNSRELRRELTNEMLEALMEQAVAAVQKMDPAEYEAKVSPAGMGRPWSSMWWGSHMHMHNHAHMPLHASFLMGYLGGGGERWRERG